MDKDIKQVLWLLIWVASFLMVCTLEFQDEALKDTKIESLPTLNFNDYVTCLKKNKKRRRASLEENCYLRKRKEKPQHA